MGKRAGFTLAEVLVSVAVLVLLVAMVCSLINSAGDLITRNSSQMEADQAACQVLDRIASDLALMHQRKDLSYLFYKGTAADGEAGSNDAIFFYGESPAPTGDLPGSFSSNALIGYRITQTNPFYRDSPVLERLGLKLNWEGEASPATAGGMVFMAYTTRERPGVDHLPEEKTTIAGNWRHLIGQAPYSTATDSSFFHVISSQVFRLEICFLLKSGTYQVALPGVPAVGPGGRVDPVMMSGITGATGYCNVPSGMAPRPPFIPKTYFADGNVYGFPPDLAGLVVTIALLDDASRHLVREKLQEIAGKLPDSLLGDLSLPPDPPDPMDPLNVGGAFTKIHTEIDLANLSPAGLPAQTWRRVLETHGFASAVQVPKAVVGQIRVYQRLIYFHAR